MSSKEQLVFEKFYGDWYFTLTRPDSGTATQSVTCSSCEKEFTLTVRSVSETRSLRREYGVQAVLATIAFLLITCVGLPLAFRASTAIPTLLLSLLDVAFLFAAFHCGFIWRCHSGVTWNSDMGTGYPWHRIWVS